MCCLGEEKMLFLDAAVVNVGKTKMYFVLG